MTMTERVRQEYLLAWDGECKRCQMCRKGKTVCNGESAWCVRQDEGQHTHSTTWACEFHQTVLDRLFRTEEMSEYAS